MRVLTLAQAAGEPTTTVGGKAKGLSRLAALDLPVPPALVLDAGAYAAFAAAGELPRELRGLLEGVLAQLGAPLAVRSSAADEDVADRSAAGQYESVMGARSVEDLLAAVAHCFGAAESDRARAYRGADAAGGVALVLQREIESRRAGVAFSVDPVSGAADEVLVEAVFGHGEGIVGGDVSPDRYRVARSGNAVRARRAAKRRYADGAGTLYDLPAERSFARVLRDDEARRVAELVLAAEDGFGAPVDVEFCWDAEALWLVQCRPVTTLRVAA